MVQCNSCNKVLSINQLGRVTDILKIKRGKSLLLIESIHPNPARGLIVGEVIVEVITIEVIVIRGEGNTVILQENLTVIQNLQ